MSLFARSTGDQVILHASLCIFCAGFIGFHLLSCCVVCEQVYHMLSEFETCVNPPHAQSRIINYMFTINGEPLEDGVKYGGGHSGMAVAEFWQKGGFWWVKVGRI